MINVVNKFFHKPTKNDIYIGRPSILGSPFYWKPGTKAKFLCKDRNESMVLYREWILSKIKNKDKQICDELNLIYKKAKKGDINLVCFCFPKDCHGMIIKDLIEEKLNKPKLHS